MLRLCLHQIKSKMSIIPYDVLFANISGNECIVQERSDILRCAGIPASETIIAYLSKFLDEMMRNDKRVDEAILKDIRKGWSGFLYSLCKKALRATYHDYNEDIVSLMYEVLRFVTYENCVRASRYTHLGNDKHTSVCAKALNKDVIGGILPKLIISNVVIPFIYEHMLPSLDLTEDEVDEFFSMSRISDDKVVSEENNSEYLIRDTGTILMPISRSEKVGDNKVMSYGACDIDSVSNPFLILSDDSSNVPYRAGGKFNCASDIDASMLNYLFGAYDNGGWNNSAFIKTAYVEFVGFLSSLLIDFCRNLPSDDMIPEILDISYIIDKYPKFGELLNSYKPKANMTAKEVLDLLNRCDYSLSNPYYKDNAIHARMYNPGNICVKGRLIPERVYQRFESHSPLPTYGCYDEANPPLAMLIGTIESRNSELSKHQILSEFSRDLGDITFGIDRPKLLSPFELLGIIYGFNDGVIASYYNLCGFIPFRIYDHKSIPSGMRGSTPLHLTPVDEYSVVISVG